MKTRKRKTEMTAAEHKRWLPHFSCKAGVMLLEMMRAGNGEAAALFLQGHKLGMWAASVTWLRRAQKIIDAAKSKRKVKSMQKSAEQKTAREQRKAVVAKLEPIIAACHAGRELEAALADPAATRAQRIMAAEHFLVLRRRAGVVETPVETLLYSVVTAHRKPH